MDLSALIFVALAVAWAVYLVPKALKHHDESDRTRTVDRFSHTMRVLARREPVDKRSARLVVTPGRPAASAVVVPSEEAPAPVAEAPAGASAPAAPVAEVPVAEAPVRRSPAQVAARRAAAARATRRRRRVLGVILAALAVVTTVAAVAVISWWWVAAPGTVLVAWLVACRLMVRREHAVRRPVARPADAAAPESPAAAPAGAAPLADADGGPETEEIAVVADPASPVVAPVLSADVPLDPSLWDPVPVTLPTYVTKPAAARRTVRTIDLDDTGVWTSGRSEADSAIAREAEEARSADKARAQREADERRATGS